jgi:hypothetical protein
MLLVEGLLADREKELLTAVDTLEALILARVHLYRSSFLRRWSRCVKQKAPTAGAAEAIQATRAKRINRWN